MMLSLGTLVVALFVPGLMAAFHLHAASLARPPAEAAPVMTKAPSQRGASSGRCGGCGVVIAMRQIGEGVELSEPGDAGTGRRELTLRMGNGSTRIISDVNPAAWRLGERISIIDGMH